MYPLFFLIDKSLYIYDAVGVVVFLFFSHLVIIHVLALSCHVVELAKSLVSLSYY